MKPVSIEFDIPVALRDIVLEDSEALFELEKEFANATQQAFKGQIKSWDCEIDYVYNTLILKAIQWEED